MVVDYAISRAAASRHRLPALTNLAGCSRRNSDSNAENSRDRERICVEDCSVGAVDRRTSRAVHDSIKPFPPLIVTRRTQLSDLTW